MPISLTKKQKIKRLKCVVCLQSFEPYYCATKIQQCCSRNCYAKLYRKKQRKFDMIRRHNKRKFVIQSYGNKCNCCGEKEYKFLTIDHVNNDGYKERGNSNGGSESFLNKVIRLGFPSIYQVLCMNCNFGKKMNNGICPHKGVKSVI